MKSNWHIEFVAQPSWTRRCLGAMILAMFIALIFSLNSYRVAANLYSQAVIRANAYQEQAAQTEQDAASSGGDKDDIASIVWELSVPWMPLLAHVDSSVGKGVAILSIEPDLKEASLKIVAQGDDIQTIMAFVERLEAGDMLGGVHIVQHQLVERQAGVQAIEFELRAEWVAAHR